MASIVYWNIHKKPLEKQICDLVAFHSADVLAILELDGDPGDLLACLRSQVSSDFKHARSVLPRFQVFTRDAGLDLGEIYSGNRFSLRRLKLAGDELLLGLVHLVDQWNWSEANQLYEVTSFSSQLREWEDRRNSRRTVLIGDFNLNPYSPAMMLAGGLNAMMTKQCTERGARTVQGEEHPFFYNPMWGLFGDTTPGPAGTYYHGSSSTGAYGWNMLDQVLVRPDATKYFSSVSIAENAGDHALVSNTGRPKTGVASDHLPLIVTLKEA